MSNGNVIGKNNKPTSSSAPGVWDLSDLYHSRLTADWPGSPLEVHVGDLTTPSATGSQSITFGGGKDWTPKAVLFFTSGSRTTSGTWQATIFQCVGFTAGASDSLAVGGSSDDNVATSNTGRTMREAAIVFVNQSGDSDPGYATLTSFDSGGFTLDWTKVSGFQPHVMYAALGGDIEAEVLNWTTPTATGNRSVSTGTFEPDLVLHSIAGTPTLASNGSAMQVGLGAMNSGGEQWTVCVSADDDEPAAVTDRYQRTDRCLSLTYLDVVRAQASWVSHDANGFTVNFDTAPGSSYQVASLCIKGVRSKLSGVAKGSSATQAVTGVGFRPSSVLFASYDAAALSTPRTQGVMSMGAYDGTNQRAVAQIDLDGQSPTQADSIWHNNAVVNIPASGPTTNSLAAASSLDADGYTLSWSPNDAANTSEILYAALAGKD